MTATFTPMPETSPHGPALVVAGSDGPGAGFVLAWAGTDGQTKLNSSYSHTGGATWDKAVVRQGHAGQVGRQGQQGYESSTAAPALAVHNGTLYLCWVDTDQRLQLMSSADHGRTWTGKRAVDQESSGAAPAIASYAGRLVVAWTGTDGAGTLNLATSADDGHTWEKVVLPEWSVAGPTLSSYVSGAGFGYLFLGFTGTDHKLRVRFCQSQSFEEFTKPGYQTQVLGETSDDAPALTVLDQGEGKDIFLAIAWTGSGNRQLNVAYSLQGFSPFGNKATAPDHRGTAAPALVTYRHFPAEPDQLVLAWTDQDAHLNFSAADKLL